LLTYLALNHTTVIKCPICGRRRGLKRVDCIRCGAKLPAPEQREVDLIFND
jgi:DNA-directed RNA polymerase subunit RPC12/RpoP